jgi:OOP family OmpA-OmpF porin
MLEVLMKVRALCALLLALAVPAAADLPENLKQVDRGAPCYRWPAVDVDGDGVYDRVDNCPGTGAGCTVDTYGCSTDGDGDGVCDGVDRCANTPAGSKVDNYGCHEGASTTAHAQPTTPPPAAQPQATTPPPPPSQPEPTENVKRLAEGGTIRLENVQFESASARLLEDSRTTLEQVARGLEQYPDARVEIQGHTDTQGSAAYNMRLSQQRADAVRTWLIENGNIAAGRLIAVGFGETKPEVSPERNDEDRVRNRRVEMRVLNPEVLPRGTKVEH